MTDPTLGICIPTYNRSKYIEELLSSIHLQGYTDIEVVISDNASIDNTKEVVSRYSALLPCLRYVYSDINVGADRNLLKCISYSTADYCWIMGSDDALLPGSLDHILTQLKEHHPLSGISLGLSICDSQLKPLPNPVPIAGGVLQGDVLFQNCDECISVLGLYFGFFSGQIVNRVIWSLVVQEYRALEHANGFVIVYCIGHILRYYPKWLYIHRPCVLNRTGNDSILSELGLYKRQYLAHVIFSQTLSTICHKSSAPYRSVLKMALHTYLIRDFLGYRFECISLVTLFRLSLIYIRVYASFWSFWLLMLPLLFTPRMLLLLIKSAYIKFAGTKIRSFF